MFISEQTRDDVTNVSERPAPRMVGPSKSEHDKIKGPYE